MRLKYSAWLSLQIYGGSQHTKAIYNKAMSKNVFERKNEGFKTWAWTYFWLLHKENQSLSWTGCCDIELWPHKISSNWTWNKHVSSSVSCAGRIWKHEVIIDFLINYIICDCIFDCIIFYCIFDYIICNCTYDFVICDCIFDYNTYCLFVT